MDLQEQWLEKEQSEQVVTEETLSKETKDLVEHDKEERNANALQR